MGLRLSEVQALADGIDRLSRTLRRGVPAQLSMSSMSALDRLQREGPMRVSALAEVEAMTQPGITLLVNRLADAGLAERVPDPSDRRAALVRLTDAGSRLLAGRLAERAQFLRGRIAELEDEDQRLLVAALPAIEKLVAGAVAPALQPSGRNAR